MVTHIATCGDSFGIGYGLTPWEDCFKKSFAGLVASHFNLPQKVYARGGCCNFTIYLQVKKIIEQLQHNLHFKPLVIVTTTFHERVLIPLDDGTKYKEPNLSQVEYLSYPPYAAPHNIKLEFDIDHKSRLLTETISNIDYFASGKSSGIDRLFKNIQDNKINGIHNYYTEVFDTAIKKHYDDSLFLTMHILMKKHNVPHVIMGHQINKLIDEPNRMDNDWGYYSKNYPDELKSGHSNEEGNKLVSLNLIDHVKKYNLI